MLESFQVRSFGFGFWNFRQCEGFDGTRTRLQAHTIRSFQFISRSWRRSTMIENLCCKLARVSMRFQESVTHLMATRCSCNLGPFSLPLFAFRSAPSGSLELVKSLGQTSLPSLVREEWRKNRCFHSAIGSCSSHHCVGTRFPSLADLDSQALHVETLHQRHHLHEGNYSTSR